jgi:hypothetical protein
MSLSARLTEDFFANVRKRGEQYHRDGRVRIQGGSESELCASVHGSQTYDVQLNFSNGILSIWCDCPHFAETGDPCKHLWAAIVAADERGYLCEPASAPNLALNPYDYDFEQDLDDELLTEPRLAANPPAAVQSLPAPNQSTWHRQLGEFLAGPTKRARSEARWPVKREVLYIIDVPTSLSRQGLFLSLQSRDRKVDGSWGRPQPLAISRSHIAQLPHAEDREILSALAGGERDTYGYFAYDRLPESCLLTPTLAGLLVPSMTRTGRCWLRAHNGSDALTPLIWDASGAWNFELEVCRVDDRRCALAGFLRRGEEHMDFSVPVLVTQGLMFTTDRVAALADEAAWQWILALRQKGAIAFSEKEQDEFLAALLSSPNLPRLTVPEEMAYQEVMPPAHPHLKIFRYRGQYRDDRLRAELSFTYNGQLISHNDPARGLFNAASRRFLHRDPDAESAAADFLDQLGVRFRRPNYWNQNPSET